MVEYNETENIHDGDDARLLPILDEIRRQQLQSEDEPDPIYWANFRLRVMQTIEQNEAARVNGFVRAWRWLTESPLRAGVVGLTSAAVVATAILLNPFSAEHTTQVAQTARPAITVARQPRTPSTLFAEVKRPVQHATSAKPMEAEATHEIAEANQSTKAMMKSSKFAENIDHAAASSEQSQVASLTSSESLHAESAAAITTVTASDGDLPVSLNDLSQGELESVLQHLQSEK